MSTIKISELLTRPITIQSLLPFSDLNGLASKGTVREITGNYAVNSLSDLNFLILNSLNGVWVIISDITLDSNKTIPSDVTLQFRKAKINLGGFTLTGTNTEIDAGLSQIFDTSGLINGDWKVDSSFTEWFGALGNGIQDDTTAIQKTLNYFKKVVFLQDKTYLISSPLTPYSNQTIFAYGSTIKVLNSISFITANGSLINFHLKGGFWSSDSVSSSTFFTATGAVGNGNGISKCSIDDVNISNVETCFYLSNARNLNVSNLRADCGTGIIYINKSAECTFSNSIFVCGDFEGRTPLYGLHCYDDGDGYPEGLSIKDTLFFRFQKNFKISDLFIGIFTGCYFDGLNKSQMAIDDTVSGREEGLSFSSCWFYKKGVIIGNTSNTSPKELRSSFNDCHFSGMSGGIDVEIEIFSHRLMFTNNRHDSDNSGTHIGYVSNNNNNNININSCTFSLYDSYVQMKLIGELNSISNIVNSDNLANPIFIEYSVNVSNVEGYLPYKETQIISASYPSGSVISTISSIKLSAGLAYVNIDISDFTATAGGFLRINIYDQGTTTVNTDTEISNIVKFTRYVASSKLLQVSLPIRVKKATNIDIELKNDAGYSSITTAGDFNGLIVSQ